MAARSPTLDIFLLRDTALPGSCPWPRSMAGESEGGVISAPRLRCLDLRPVTSWLPRTGHGLLIHCLFCSSIIGNSFYSCQLSSRLAPDTQAASLGIYIKSVFISHCHKFSAAQDTDHKEQRGNILCLNISSQFHRPQFLSMYEYQDVFLVL